MSSIPASVISAYGLRGARVIEKLESYGNDNWLIATADGDRCVLRRQHLNGAPERIALQLALQRHLAARGLASPQPVAAQSGEVTARDESGTAWLLLEYVPGEHYDFARVAQSTAAGRTLALFHRAGESFAPSGPPPEHIASMRECWANADADAAEMAAMFAGDAAAREALAWLATRWDRVRTEWPTERVAQLPAGWVHGDYHGRNLVYDGDTVVALLDFDDVDRDAYVCDVAAGAFKFGRASRGTLEFRPAYARAFVAGYESVRPLTAEERAALPVMVAIGRPPHPKNYRFWRQRRGVPAGPRLLREIATMQALQARADRLAQIAG